MVVDRLFEFGIQNGHGVSPPAPNECVINAGSGRYCVGGDGGDDVRFRGGDVEMDDEVMAGEDDCCVGEVSDQDGHGLPIRSPLAYIDYNGSD